MVSETRGLGSDVKQELVEHLQKSCERIEFLNQDASVTTDEALSSQISRPLKDGKKVVVLRTMDELVGLKTSTERKAMLNKIGTCPPHFVSSGC